ncbi:MAG: hypothetical protein WC709_09920 [Thermoleophilia bacterium]
MRALDISAGVLAAGALALVIAVAADQGSAAPALLLAAPVLVAWAPLVVPPAGLRPRA